LDGDAEEANHEDEEQEEGGVEHFGDLGVVGAGKVRYTNI
jgi:hypothetical protein